jgi:hypothetical protein
VGGIPDKLQGGRGQQNGHADSGSSPDRQKKTACSNRAHASPNPCEVANETAEKAKKRSGKANSQAARRLDARPDPLDFRDRMYEATLVENFESLVRGERDLAEMHALKQVGLGQVALDTFTKGFMEIVLNAALSAIP